MNKNKTIVYAALACMLTLGGGAATLRKTNANADATVLDKLVMQDGMSIRTDEPEGLRFSATINMTKAAMTEAGIQEVGMVLMPADKVDGALEYDETNGTATALLIPTVEYYEETDASLSWHSVLVNTGGTGAFPAEFYNTPIMARAYAKYSETEYLYSETTVTRSIGYVATMCQLSGDTGYDSAVVTKIAGTTAKEIAINGGEILSVDEADGYQATLTIGGLKVETTEDVTVSWSVSDGDAVTVDGNGKVTAVKGGAATVKATVAYADGSSTEITKSVTVENVQRTVLTQYEWEKYTTLNEGARVANTEDFVIDLATANIEGEKAISLPVGAYEAKLLKGTSETALTNVSVADNKITLKASELSASRVDTSTNIEWSSFVGGEYNLVVETDGYKVIVPVTLINKVIKNADDLLNFKAYADNVYDSGVQAWGSGATYVSFAYNGYFKLGANIRLGSTAVTTAKATFDYAGKFTSAGFQGTFDGNGYTITGGQYGLGGLFGMVAQSGVIKEVAFLEATVVNCDSGWNNSETAGVIASSFNGTAIDVLVDVVNCNNAKYCGAFGTTVKTANFTNVVVYYAGSTSSDSKAVAFYPSGATSNNLFVFSDLNSGVTGESKYAYSAKLSETTMATAGFDTDIWRLSGDKAAFVQPAYETVTVTNAYEYEKYVETGKNTNDFVIDLTSAKTIGEESLSFINGSVCEAMFGDVTVPVESASATSITIDAAAMENVVGGKYNLQIFVNGGEYLLVIPVTVINKVIKTADDLVNFRSYADNVKTVTWAAWETSGEGTDSSGTSYDGYFKLGNDIDLTGKGIISSESALIYYSNAYTLAVGFHGTFDGCGYAIKNGVFGKGGLFGFVGENGVIENVAFVNVGFADKTAAGTDTGANRLAIVCAGFQGTIRNVLFDIANLGTNTTDSAIFGYSAPQATFENMIVYYGNLSSASAALYVSGGSGTKTFENVYVFARESLHVTLDGVTCYTYETALSATDIATKDFDTTMWDLSGDKAAFVKKTA